MKFSNTTATREASGLYPSDPSVMSASRGSTKPTMPPPAYTARDSRANNGTENWPLNDSPSIIPAPLVSLPPSRPSLSNMYTDSISAILAAMVHAIASLVTLIVSIPALDFYADERHKVQGSGNRGYGTGGSVISLLVAMFSVFMIVSSDMIEKATISRFIVVCLYALGGALIGYSTYLVRHDEYCDPRYTYNQCVPIHITTGWRCGIAAISMCGVIVLVETMAFSVVLVDYVICRFRKTPNPGNSAV